MRTSLDLALALLAGAFVLAGVVCALIGTRRSFPLWRNLLNLCVTTVVMGMVVAELLVFPNEGCIQIPLPMLALGGFLIALPPCGIGFTVTFAIQRAMLDIQRKRRTHEEATQSASSR